jgi:phospholipase D1/2
MSHFFNKISELAQKAEKVDVSRLADKVYDHTRNEIIGERSLYQLLATPLNSCLQGFVNPNREHLWEDVAFNSLFSLHLGRHDEPEEIMNDKIREEINNSHRFNSFADRRFENFVKWYVTVSLIEV